MELEWQDVRKESTWKNAVVYQVYPWTFAEDTERQPQLGHGSLRGIQQKMSYLERLGVNAIWLSPFYEFPMIDGGYDIANFTSIHPDLGTMEDFDELVKTAHEHSIRLMVDFIPNHTSDKHEWFQKSRQREEGYDDWYIWHPGTQDEQGNRHPPNNWASVFSMPQRRARARGEMDYLRPEEWTPPISAWKWDDVRQEFYLHSFAVEQPDLNWSNPYVRDAMKNVMRFWLDRGVDGFRVDAVNHIGKNMDLPNEEVNTAYNEEWFENPYDQLIRYNSAGYPEPLHEYIWEMCQVLKDEAYEQRDVRLILEAYMGEAELRDLDTITPEVASTFNFGALNTDWNAQRRKIQMDYYYERLQPRAVGNQVNGNHDKSRLVSRLGDAGARAAAVMNLFLPGMRFIYNGEELGLADDMAIPLERLQDPNGLRDPERTPIPWDDALPNVGFSNAMSEELWLPTNPADQHKAVSRQERNPRSSLALYRAAIRLCHELPVVNRGEYISLHTDNDQVLAYGREDHEGNQVVVLTNFSRDRQGGIKVTDSRFVIGEVVLSSVNVREDTRKVDLRAGITLEADESLVIRGI